MGFFEVYSEINMHKYMECTQIGKAAFWKKSRNIKTLKCSSNSNDRSERLGIGAKTWQFP